MIAVYESQTKWIIFTILEQHLFCILSKMLVSKHKMSLHYFSKLYRLQWWCKHGFTWLGLQSTGWRSPPWLPSCRSPWTPCSTAWTSSCLCLFHRGWNSWRDHLVNGPWWRVCTFAFFRKFWLRLLRPDSTFHISLPSQYYWFEIDIEFTIFLFSFLVELGELHCFTSCSRLRWLDWVYRLRDNKFPSSAWAPCVPTPTPTHSSPSQH